MIMKRLRIQAHRSEFTFCQLQIDRFIISIIHAIQMNPVITVAIFRVVFFKLHKGPIQVVHAADRYALQTRDRARAFRLYQEVGFDQRYIHDETSFEVKALLPADSTGMQKKFQRF